MTQIKVGIMTMYYFNNIYIEGGEEIKEKCKENERKRRRVRMRGREFLYFSRDAAYMGCKKPFIGFII